MDYKELPGPIEGYKIFNEDMTCKGFKFKIGMNELENNDPLKLCKNGFHFCKYPSGVWSYYNNGRVFKIRAYDVLEIPVEPGSGFKLVCRKIEVLEEIKITGYWNTGYKNTGDRNTGDSNTGDRNTGDRNTGYWNTGNWNTGYGSVGNNHSNSLCMKNEPIKLFDLIVKDPEKIDWDLVTQLCLYLSQDKNFDITPFLQIPNATEKRIKKLHQAHIEARKAKKE
jgi:hypothetical protein